MRLDDFSPSIDATISSDDFQRRLLSLDRTGAARLLQRLRSEHSPLEIIDRVIMPALEHLGRRWDHGQVALAQVYMSSRICEESIAEILLPGGRVRFQRPRMAIAVLLDHHMLGKRTVASILRSAGYEVRDYGRQTPAELAWRAADDGIEVLLVSVLMLSSALRIKELREHLDAASCSAKIVVGGAPFRFDPRLWLEVGADATGRSAADALAIVEDFAKELS
jgi:methylmalonyl-CoA mutase cobalamin-binding domain/chain